MAEIAEKLLKMKNEIDEAKTKKARLEGQKDNLYERLKSEFSCANLAVAQRKLNKMDKDIDQMEKTLETSVAALEEKYEWGHI